MPVKLHLRTEEPCTVCLKLHVKKLTRNAAARNLPGRYDTIHIGGAGRPHYFLNAPIIAYSCVLFTVNQVKFQLNA